MDEVLILDAVRTPVGTYGGALAPVRPDDLAAHVLQALVRRTGIDPSQLEEVVLGCANQAGEDNRNVARMALLLAGLPENVAGITVNRLCASGLDAIIHAYRAIAVGEGGLYIAGGVESMTRAPFVMGKSQSPYDRTTQIFDTTIGWRFANPRFEKCYGLDSMGETAENIRESTGISRERQDRFALESQRRAVEAINEGRFREEMIPVSVQLKGETHWVNTDEHPRMRFNGERFELTTSMESLGKLRPVFREDGTVTAGNSSGINDGGAVLLLASRREADRLGIQPLARIVASAAAGVEPRQMGLGPIPATRRVLQRAGLGVHDLGLIELNEAFAVQALAVMDELQLPAERTNVNGGAIALGHPLGCSGARLMTSLVHEMRRRRDQGGSSSPYGLVTLCVGVGQGVAVIVERAP
jgi:3-oxoadipyl-CoA thiolase